jgi:hypothetical protein
MGQRSAQSSRRSRGKCLTSLAKNEKGHEQTSGTWEEPALHRRRPACIVNMRRKELRRVATVEDWIRLEKTNSNARVFSSRDRMREGEARR